MRSAKVCLLIPTHALPPLSYDVPESIREIRVGSVVSARLSGRSRAGVVTSVSTEEDDSATEDVCAVSLDIRLPEPLVRVCERVASGSVLSLASVLRAALPPGMRTDLYLIRRTIRGFDPGTGSSASRRALAAKLGDDGLKRADSGGSIVLVPSLPEPRTSEWVRAEGGWDLTRAPRQKEMFEVIASDGEMRVRDLLAPDGMSRPTLRALVKRGAVTLEKRPVRDFFKLSTENSPSSEPWNLPTGAWISMAPTAQTGRALLDFAAGVTSKGKRLLVLAPEVSGVEAAAEWLTDGLPSGIAISVLHAGVEERAGVWESVSSGESDVLVGTRSAALFPVRNIGGICVLDEPNSSHRASPGHEGLDIHVREIARHRGEAEGCPVLFVSPHPSLKLYSGVVSGEVGEAVRAWPEPWPKVRIVDMRNSGATISSAALELCRDALDEDETVGVVSSRLGFAASVSCRSCGAVVLCPRCELPLSVQTESRLACTGCGFHRDYEASCPECASPRMSPGGLSLESLRDLLESRLDVSVGTTSAGKSRLADARIVVGTPRSIAARSWDYVIVPDADALFSAGYMSAVERAFRVVHGCAEATKELLLVQSRNPGHAALRAALTGDYPAFAHAELSRRRSLGYPPFVHLASLTFTGTHVAGAVKSLVRRHAGRHEEVTFTDPVRVDVPGAKSALRVLIRSPQPESVARAGLAVARDVAKERSKGLRVTVEVDPEEV